MANLDKLTTYATGIYAASLLVASGTCVLLAPVPIQGIFSIMVPFCAGCLLGDYLLGPKLADPRSRTSQRWGEVAWIWMPYRWLVREFGQWVHYTPFLSTGLRIAIAASLPALGVGLWCAAGLPIGGIWWAIAKYRLAWAFLFLGLDCAAFIHGVIQGLEQEVRKVVAPIHPESPTQPQQAQIIPVLWGLLNSAVDRNQGVCHRCGARHEWLRSYPHTAGLHRDWCPVPELSEFLNNIPSKKTVGIQ